MLEYGSTDLQALVQITGEGGAWSNPALVALLTEQPTEADECQQLCISFLYVYSCSVQLCGFFFSVSHLIHFIIC